MRRFHYFMQLKQIQNSYCFKTCLKNKCRYQLNFFSKISNNLDSGRIDKYGQTGSDKATGQINLHENLNLQRNDSILQTISKKETEIIPQKPQSGPLTVNEKAYRVEKKQRFSRRRI